MPDGTPAGAPESRDYSVTYAEHQFPLGVQDIGVQPHVLALVAWAILSAAYSAEDEASVEFLAHQDLQNTVQIRFHLDTVQYSAQDVFDQVQEKLDGRDRGPNSRSHMINVVREAEANPSLPATLVAESIDDTVHSLIMQRKYDLAIALETSAQDSSDVLLNACYSNNVTAQELDLLHTRVKELIAQLRGGRDRKIKDLDLLTAFDKEQLRALNEPMPPAVHELAHKVIEAQARLHPHNEAVCAWDGSFTYEELERHVLCLSKNLVHRGVTVGSWVPLLLGKSKWHIVSMLAILRTGAAIVALDVAMPEGRISNVLKQLDSLPLALVSETQQHKLQGIVEQIVVFDEALTTTDIPEVALPQAGVEGGIQYDQPAYVIFTSGSTGIPKGAVMEHRNLTTSIKALNKEISATPELRSFQLTVLNLDFCISEIFSPLFCGGCVCIPSEWSRYNDIAGAVDNLNANLMSLSPTLLSTMAVKDFPKLKAILLAGERVWKDLTDLWSDAGKRALQMYGPTECTVGCCFLDPDVTTHYTGRIGSPYASKFWIVDPQNSDQLMPVGAPGEILIEGPVVGRCYLGDPEKTREIFIEPPSWFSSICEREPVRFYKTGDLGRLSKHGDYEIVGRKDSQVKVRGWRIEVLEIEHQIRMACGSNIGVAVEVRNPTCVPGQEMLVAFLELQKRRDHEGTTTLDIIWEELASSETPFAKMIDHAKVTLRKFLPTYMMPSAYIPIRSFPMTNIFKLNRRILRDTANTLAITDILNPIPDPQRKPTDRPLSEGEETLREIWADALHIAPSSVHVNDDFFSLGGDSLKAMAVVSAARRKGMNLSIAKLYQFRSVADLTQNTSEDVFDEPQDQQLSLLDTADAPSIQKMAAEQCSVEPEMIQDIMSLTDMQHFYVEGQVHQPRAWLSAITFDFPSSLDTERVKHAWEQLMAHHSITRTRFVNIQLGIFQVILKSEAVSWSSGSDQNEALRNLEANIQGFGFPSHATAILHNKDQTPSRLIWLANHGLLDHLMIELLSQDLATLWRHGSPSLPKRPAFKRVIQHRFESDRASSRAFWRSHLHGAEFRPLFREDQATDALANSKLSQETSVDVPACVEVSEYTVAIVALSLALTRVTGVEDLAFSMVRSGRVSGLPGGEDVMGPLLARAPLRVSVKRGRLAADMLRDADRDFKEASKHEIVRLEDFQSVSAEAAMHARHAFSLNFQPPTSDLTLGPGALFPVNSDLRDGVAERNRIFGIFAKLFHGKLTMDSVYDEEVIPRSVIQKLLDDWQSMLQLLAKVDLETTVDGMLSA